MLDDNIQAEEEPYLASGLSKDPDVFIYGLLLPSAGWCWEYPGLQCSTTLRKGKHLLESNCTANLTFSTHVHTVFTLRHIVTTPKLAYHNNDISYDLRV